MSRLTKNIAFNYLGQGYIAGINFLLIPFYIKLAGSEGYGLIGFYILLQTAMQLLDLGFSPTIGREIARLKDIPHQSKKLWNSVRSLEIIFIIIGSLVATIFIISRHWIATDWLKASALPINIIESSLFYIGLTIVFKWICLFYRGCINACEEQVWVNKNTIIFTTLYGPLSLLVLITYKDELHLFFLYQLIIAILELGLLARKLYSSLPISLNKQFSLKEIKEILPFSIKIAYTAGLWTAITQLDRIILSKQLSLSEYGYFSLITSLSSGLFIISSPISKAILPRMNSFHSQEKKTELLSIYKKSLTIIISICLPVSFIISTYSYDVIFLWTQSKYAADWASPILPYYIISTSFLCISSYQYYLQFIYGDLKRHIIVYSLLSLIAPFLIYFLIAQFGAKGGGFFWLGVQGLFLFFWMPYIHSIFFPGINKDWFISLLTKSFLLSIIVSVLSKRLIAIDTIENQLLKGSVLAMLIILTSLVTIAMNYKRENLR